MISNPDLRAVTSLKVFFVAYLYVVIWKWTHWNRLCVLQVNYDAVLQSCDGQVGDTRTQDSTVKFTFSQRFILHGHRDQRRLVKTMFNDDSSKPSLSVCFQTSDRNMLCKTKLNKQTWSAESSDLEHGALLVKIELDSGGLLLLLWGQVLCEGGRKLDGALGDGGVTSGTPSDSGIPTDLWHIQIVNRKTYY